MIDKITFCEVIENLRQQIYFDRKIGDILKEAFALKASTLIKMI
jgi:hypothetical protein